MLGVVTQVLLKIFMKLHVPEIMTEFDFER